MWTCRKTKCIKCPHLVNYVHTCFKRLKVTFGSNSVHLKFFILVMFHLFVTDDNGKSVLYDQPTHVSRESVNCRPLVDCSLADCWPLVGHLLVISRPSVGC